MEKPYTDDNTGAVEMDINPKTQMNFMLLPGIKQEVHGILKSRKTSGIYKSIDGGDTWKLIAGRFWLSKR
jgi:hypothetical protein